jgi:hypothetical protein
MAPKADTVHMFDDPTPALYSTQTDDPERLEAISDFVIALAARVDRLQDAQVVADYGQLGTLCRSLESNATNLGYPRLADIAREVAVACSLEKEESIELGLIAITDSARRIRQGHRGSV